MDESQTHAVSKFLINELALTPDDEAYKSIMRLYYLKAFDNFNPLSLIMAKMLSSCFKEFNERLKPFFPNHDESRKNALCMTANYLLNRGIIMTDDRESILVDVKQIPIFSIQSIQKQLLSFDQIVEMMGKRIKLQELEELKVPPCVESVIDYNEVIRKINSCIAWIMNTSKGAEIFKRKYTPIEQKLFSNEITRILNAAKDSSPSPQVNLNRVIDTVKLYIQKLETLDGELKPGAIRIGLDFSLLFSSKKDGRSVLIGAEIAPGVYEEIIADETAKKAAAALAQKLVEQKIIDDRKAKQEAEKEAKRQTEEAKRQTEEATRKAEKEADEVKRKDKLKEQHIVLQKRAEQRKAAAAAAAAVAVPSPVPVDDEQKRLAAAAAAEKKRIDKEEKAAAEKKRLEDAAAAEQKRRAAESEKAEKAKAVKRIADAAAAEKKRIDDAAEKKRRDDAAEQKRIADAAEKKRRDDAAEQKRIADADAAEKKRIADAAEKKRIDDAAEQKRIAAAAAAEIKRIDDAIKAAAAAAAAAEKKRIDDAEKAAAAAAAAAVAKQKRIDDAAAAAAADGINLDDFRQLFSCDYLTMREIAERIRRLTDEAIQNIFQSNYELFNYMITDRNNVRALLVIGLLRSFLNKEHEITLVGKYALQLTATSKHKQIMSFNKYLHPLMPVDSTTALGICLDRRSSDLDAWFLSIEAERFKKTFMDIFLKFFDATEIMRHDEEVKIERFQDFLLSKNRYLTKAAAGYPGIVKVLRSAGDGFVTNVADFAFKNYEQEKLVFPNIEPIVLSDKKLDDALKRLMGGGGAPIPPIQLTFQFPDLLSLLNEYVHIIVSELTKILANKNMFMETEYYFVFTSTLLKFFSRAIQMSYIQMSKIYDEDTTLFMKNPNNTTRAFFMITVNQHTQNEEILKIINEILNLFLVDENKLNPETFHLLVLYRETAKPDYKTRASNNLHRTILDIFINKAGLVEPPPHRMGGKKIKKTIKTIKTIKRKINKSKTTRKKIKYVAKYTKKYRK